MHSKSRIKYKALKKCLGELPKYILTLLLKLYKFKYVYI